MNILRIFCLVATFLYGIWAWGTYGIPIPGVPGVPLVILLTVSLLLLLFGNNSEDMKEYSIADAMRKRRLKNYGFCVLLLAVGVMGVITFGASTLECFDSGYGEDALVNAAVTILGLIAVVCGADQLNQTLNQ